MLFPCSSLKTADIDGHELCPGLETRPCSVQRMPKIVKPAPVHVALGETREGVDQRCAQDVMGDRRGPTRDEPPVGFTLQVVKHRVQDLSLSRAALDRGRVRGGKVLLAKP